MQHTLKLSALALSGVLALASCGGGGTPPAPGTGTTQPPATTTPAVPGGTITVPAGSTAANEFIITGVRAQMLAQSLGVQSLDAQATNEEMRVLLAVKRSTSGSNAGKKQATATFVWGNQTEAIVPIDKDTTSVQLDIYPQANPQYFQRATSSLNLKAVYPDFQDKTTKSGEYITDTGAMCARLAFNFKTDAASNPLVFNNADAPLEVCEGDTERAAERVALEKASNGLMFTHGSVGASPLTYVKFDGQAALPTAEAFNALAGTSGTVTVQTIDAFFAPLVVLPEGDSKTWTPEQKAQAAIARKYAALKKQFGYYYREHRVYTVTNGSRAEVYILGLNGWGIGGLKTFQFL